MAEKELKVRLLNACKTESAWAASNPILKLGEVAYSSDKNYQFKVGNNSSKWSDLPYNKSAAVSPLSIKLNASAAVDYDGSTAKTISITAASIGASASSHTHLYAGSTSTGGPAISAIKDSSNQQINTTYIKNVTGNGTSITITKGNGTVDTTTISDTRVYQSSTTADTFRGLMLGTNNSSDPSTLDNPASGQAYVNERLYVQPSTGTIFSDKSEAKFSVKIGGATLIYDDAAKALNFNFA